MIDISNIASLAALNDTLRSTGFSTSDGFDALSTGILSGLRAGETNSSALRVSLDTSADGRFTGTASVSLQAQWLD